MRLFEVDSELTDLKDDILGLLLASRAAGLEKISVDELLTDIHRGGEKWVGIDELMLLLRSMPGIAKFDPRTITLKSSSPEQRYEKRQEDIINKMAVRALSKEIG